MEPPDADIVDLHRSVTETRVVTAQHGPAWRLAGGEGMRLDLGVGAEIEIGDTILVPAGSRVDLGGLQLPGGNHGRTYALVPETAFRGGPGRADVPRLIAQLNQIEQEMASQGQPLPMTRSGPRTPYERAQSAEFARLNFDPAAARLLSEDVARRIGAVCLFVSQDTAFVATDSLDLPKLRALMSALSRPVTPHLVAPEVLEELLDRAFGDGSSGASGFSAGSD